MVIFLLMDGLTLHYNIETSVQNITNKKYEILSHSARPAINCNNCPKPIIIFVALHTMFFCISCHGNQCAGQPVNLIPIHADVALGCKWCSFCLFISFRCYEAYIKFLWHSKAKTSGIIQAHHSSHFGTS